MAVNSHLGLYLELGHYCIVLISMCICVCSHTFISIISKSYRRFKTIQCNIAFSHGTQNALASPQTRYSNNHQKQLSDYAPLHYFARR